MLRLGSSGRVRPRQVHFDLLSNFGIEAVVSRLIRIELLSKLYCLTLQEDILYILIHVLGLVLHLKALTIHFNQRYLVLVQLVQLAFEPLQADREHFTFLQVKSQMQSRKVLQIIDTSLCIELAMQSLVYES